MTLMEWSDELRIEMVAWDSFTPDQIRRLVALKLDMLRNLEPRWIPVAEALPPVWKKVEIRTTGEMSPSYDIDPFHGPFWDATGYKTTHWRELEGASDET